MKKLFLALLLFPIYIAGNCAEIITVDGSEYIINNYDTTTVTIIKADITHEYSQTFRIPETISYHGKTKTVTDVGGYYSSFFPSRMEYYSEYHSYIPFPTQYTLYLPKTIKTIQGALTDNVSFVSAHFDEGNDLEYICENAFNSKSNNVYYALHLGRKLELPSDFEFSRSYDMTFDTQSDYYDYRDGCIYRKGVTDKILTLLPANAVQNIVIPANVRVIEKPRLPVLKPDEYMLTNLTIQPNNQLKETADSALTYCRIGVIPPMEVKWGALTFLGSVIDELNMSEGVSARTSPFGPFASATVFKLVFSPSMKKVKNDRILCYMTIYDIDWGNIENIDNRAFFACTFMNDFHLPKGFTGYFGGAANCKFMKDAYFKGANTGTTGLDVPNSTFYEKVYCDGFNYLNFYSTSDGGFYHGSTFYQKIVCPSSVKQINNSAFEKAELNNGIKLNEGLNKIGESAFSEATFDSTVVVIPQGTEVASSAFHYSKKLNSLEWNEKPFVLDLVYTFVNTLLLRGTTEIGSLSFNSNFINKVAFTSKTPPTVNGTFVSDDYLKDRTITFGSKQFFIENIYSRITLYVPRGSKTTYQRRAPWSYFDNIVEYDSLSEVSEYFKDLRGDVNADNIVDVKDVSSLISNVLAGSSDVLFDVNNDNVVDVKDVTALINLILE